MSEINTTLPEYIHVYTPPKKNTQKNVIYFKQVPNDSLSFNIIEHFLYLNSDLPQRSIITYSPVVDRWSYINNLYIHVQAV